MCGYPRRTYAPLIVYTGATLHSILTYSGGGRARIGAANFESLKKPQTVRGSDKQAFTARLSERLLIVSGVVRLADFAGRRQAYSFRQP